MSEIVMATVMQKLEAGHASWYWQTRPQCRVYNNPNHFVKNITDLVCTHFKNYVQLLCLKTTFLKRDSKLLMGLRLIQKTKQPSIDIQPSLTRRQAQS